MSKLSKPRARIREVGDFRRDTYRVVRIIPRGHRLHPNDAGTAGSIWERYRGTPGGHELERSVQGRQLGDPLVDPLFYIPDLDGMSLIDAVRLHHRTQMYHARHAGAQAFDMYAEVA